MSTSPLRSGHGAAPLVVIALGLVLRVSTAEAEQGPPSFRQAYELERRELLAEKTALQHELEELRRRNEALEQELEREIASIQGSIPGVEHSAEMLEEELGGVNERIVGIEEDHDLIDSTLEVAAHSLGRLGVEVNIDGDARDALDRVLTAGVATMTKLGTVHTERGRFFSKHGEELSGTIVNVGGVAALGSSDGVGGVLARESDGHLVIVDETAQPQAKRIMAGEQLPLTPVYILPPGGEASHRDPHRAPMQTIRAGGIIAWIILGLGAFALLMIFERLVTLSLVSRRSTELASRVEQKLRSGDVAEALSEARRPGALARVMATVLAHHGEPRDRLDELAAEAVLKETASLARFFPMLNVVVAVAPLLGLLGTVTGMISTFEVITEYGTGDPRNLSGGISVALITTEFGLGVAIPVLLLTSWLNRWSERITEELQIQSMALINLMTAPGGSSAVEPS